jgi:hypothetical protein
MVADSEETRKMIDGWAKITSPADAEPFIAARIREGSDYIKLMQESGKPMGHSYPIPTRETQMAIVAEAHKHGLKVVAHATSLEDTILVLEFGVDGLAHTFCDQAPTPELVALYKKNNAWVCPTLAATGSMCNEGLDVALKLADDQRVVNISTEEDRKQLCCCMNVCPKGKQQYAFDSVRMLKEAGIDILW